MPTDQSATFPARYEPIEQLGKGGGGEVWAARDRLDGQVVALKLLRAGAPEAEVLALVREATMLSAIEGVGVPRVLHFGRLPRTDRAYMVRELIDGESLSDMLDGDTAPAVFLGALAESADLLSRLHRALLLHGDVKPANIIVGPDGKATLVDLGLAAQWREGGAVPEGLTPRYAAPELFHGEPLTPQAEVFALGASLGEVLQRGGSQLDAAVRQRVQAVVDRATATSADARYPSTDEFSQALRSAAGLAPAPRASDARSWSVVGLDGPSTELLEQVSALEPGAGLVVAGPPGSGRSALLRRMAWSLGVAGTAVAHITKSDACDLDTAVSLVLEGRSPEGVVLAIDDGDQRDEAELARLDELRAKGCVLVIAMSSDGAGRVPGKTFGLFQVPPLSRDDAAGLVRRMIPSLSDTLVQHLLDRTGCLPGLLRTTVERLEGAAVVSVDDLEQRLDEVPRAPGVVVPPGEIHRMLDRGRFEDAADALAAHAGERTLQLALARARLATGRGDPRLALKELATVQDRVDDADSEDAASWHVQKGRALFRAGAYDEAEEHANLALRRLGGSLIGEVTRLSGAPDPTPSTVGTLASEALTVCGLAQSYSGSHEESERTLRRSVDVARSAGEPRMLAVALGSLAFTLQRNDRLDEAQKAHEEALSLAEQAGSAGHVATTRLNLAGIARIRGDLSGAIEHLEAAVDMGRRSGRHSTVRQALLNLANLDLYVGRLARAEQSIATLVEERARLGQVAQANLLALEAEAANLRGDLAAAEAKCEACASAYETLGRKVDAAEAVLERALYAVHGPSPDLGALQEHLFRARALLGESAAHRSLLLVASAQVARLAGELEQAESTFAEAIESATQAGQREWLWRAYEGRSRVHSATGDRSAQNADRASALKVLEEVARPLPADLREVYWNDPRRRALRGKPASQSYRPPSQAGAGSEVFSDVNAPTQLGLSVPQDRLSRVLAINREIAGEHDLDKLLELVTDHAIALLSAERGFVLLRSRSGDDRLSVHAVRDRDGGDPHARFSRSIAERVVRTGEPFVALDAGVDERVSDYVSVHQLMLRSVACVPIRSRGPRAIGALYIETRVEFGSLFRQELATLAALADQVAIAIETARLLAENKQRADALEKANADLEKARAKLEELLGRRTEQLATTRRDLRSARDVLKSHFGYRGIVGTSVAMRRVYAVIDRVKDAEVPVLITGESGTGKEVIARAIHQAGPRAKQRFTGVNCGAIPDHLLESELFGHVRGAFTGADREKKGLFRELDKGTILLDEIGEMPQKMQAGLLRVLQEKVVRPVGGTKEERVATRVIAATHRHLAEMVKAGTFREDLYYRLHVIEIRVPSLRERLEDVPLLIDHFLRLFSARYGREKRKVSREALKRLMAYRWPGNVRQLENVLLNAWILSDGAELEPDDFELPADVPAPKAIGGPSMAAVPSSAERPATAAAHGEQEKDRILAALEACGWNRAKAATQIGMPRRTFYRRLKKYGIQ